MANAPVNPDPNKHHVSTWPPSENVAPEVYPDAIRQEPGAAAQSDDINISMVLISVVFSGLLVIVMICLVDAYYRNSTNAEVEAKAVPSPQLASMRENWQEQLNAPAGWTDAKKTAVRMPIDQAIAAEVAIQAAAQAPVQMHKPKGSE